MTSITTELATPALWTDVQHTFNGGGDGPGCQCAWWTLTNAQFNASTRDERTALLQQEIDDGPPPGIVAYVDGDAAGWVRVGPRTVQHRIARTRNIITATPEPLDDDAVWAITCFVVRKEYRGQGLNAALLRAAVGFARESGARTIEAYPIDTAGAKHNTNDMYHGSLSTFLAEGFTQTAIRKPGLPIVALPLSA